jgi:Na+/H+ antiporter NhaD/arsenite permease-like protein
VDSTWKLWLTLAWFSLTYLGLALGRIPGLRMDRASIALVGAILILITGVLTLGQATSSESIDYKTLALLFGMMIVVGFLRLSGVFQHLSVCALKRIHTPFALLVVTILLSGLLSAFLINDIVCIALTPLILHLTRRLRCDPIPHLIALATAANIGSAGTITGNPQNIYIGAHSGISYLQFASRLLPLAAVGLAMNLLVVAAVYWKVLFSAENQTATDEDKGAASQDSESGIDVAQAALNRRPHRWLRRKSVAVTIVMVGLFFSGLPLELIALGAAGFLLLSRVKTAKVINHIDWSLLVMFTGLFIVVHAFQVYVVAGWGVESWTWLLAHPITSLSLVSAGLSNLVSNVPAVLLMEPVLNAMPNDQQVTAWLALAMSSTFAGNFTVLGSVANLIVVESARREGVNISFWEYCKVGIPLTLLTMAVGIAWLLISH